MKRIINSESLAIFIPTYNRSKKIVQLFKQLQTSTKVPISVYFIVEKNDNESLKVLKEHSLKSIINTGEPSYASCINIAYLKTKESIFFVGADDLYFKTGWIEKALPLLDRFDVVGTNDGSPQVLRGALPSHFFIKRSYIENHSGCLDKKNVVFHNYRHYCVDAELVLTAKARNVFAPCLESEVIHLRDMNKKQGVDATFIKNIRYYIDDYWEYLQRSKMWKFYSRNINFLQLATHNFLNLIRFIVFILQYYYENFFILTKKSKL